MKKALFFLSLFLLIYHSFSEPISGEEPSEMEEWLRQQDEQSLQELRVTNPLAYEEAMEERKRFKEFTSIVNAFHEGKMDVAEAKRRLTPLVKRSVEQRIKNSLDFEIEETKMRLEYLKKIKRNPNQFVNDEVELQLGLRTPENGY